MPAFPGQMIRLPACLVSVRGPFLGLGEIVGFALFFLAFRA